MRHPYCEYAYYDEDEKGNGQASGRSRPDHWKYAQSTCAAFQQEWYVCDTIYGFSLQSGCSIHAVTLTADMSLLVHDC